MQEACALTKQFPRASVRWQSSADPSQESGPSAMRMLSWRVKQREMPAAEASDGSPPAGYSWEDGLWPWYRSFCRYPMRTYINIQQRHVQVRICVASCRATEKDWPWPSAPRNELERAFLAKQWGRRTSSTFHPCFYRSSMIDGARMDGSLHDLSQRVQAP